jgi:hypothetical protein
VDRSDVTADPFFDFAEIPLFGPNQQDQAISRAYVEAGRCPVCGDGPFAVVAGHTMKKHGLDRYALREMLGVYRTTSVCDAGHAAACRARGLRAAREGRLALTGPRGTGKRVLSEAAQRANREKLALAHAKAGQARTTLAEKRAPQRAERIRQVTELWQAGRSTAEISAELGIVVQSVVRWLKLAGIYDKHEVLHRRSRANQSGLDIGRRRRAERCAATRVARVARFAELGGDYAASERLAAEEGMDGKNLRTQLRKDGCVVPDGRGATAKRRVRQPVPLEQRRRCEVEGCDGIMRAKGLCGMHYQRARKPR